MKWTSLAAVVLSAALAAACSGNKATEEPSTAATPGIPAADSGDRTFIEHMLDAHLAEVELGKLAAERGMDPDVKKFGSMMMSDHAKSGAALDTIATRQGIPALAQREEKHRELREKLMKLQGAEFDREYMDAMVDSHEDVYEAIRSRVDIGNFGEDKGVVTPEKESNPVEGDVNQWAAGTLGVVISHIEEARFIQDQLKSRNTTN